MPNWENLVGKTGDQAKAQILSEMPDAQVQILPQGTPTTRDYCFTRVRVFVDSGNKVVSAPNIG